MDLGALNRVFFGTKERATLGSPSARRPLRCLIGSVCTGRKCLNNDCLSLLRGTSGCQPAAVQKSGQIVTGSTLVNSAEYVLAADNPGFAAPYADLVTGNYCTVLGIAISTAVLQLAPNPLGTTHV